MCAWPRRGRASSSVRSSASASSWAARSAPASGGQPPVERRGDRGGRRVDRLAGGALVVHRGQPAEVHLEPGERALLAEQLGAERPAPQRRRVPAAIRSTAASRAAVTSSIIIGENLSSSTRAGPGGSPGVSGRRTSARSAQHPGRAGGTEIAVLSRSGSVAPPADRRRVRSGVRAIARPRRRWTPRIAPGAHGGVHYGVGRRMARRWRAASNNSTVAAIAALRLSTPPRTGDRQPAVDGCVVGQAVGLVADDQRDRRGEVDIGVDDAVVRRRPQPSQAARRRAPPRSPGCGTATRPWPGRPWG